MTCIYLFNLIDFIVGDIFRFTEKFHRKYREFEGTPCPETPWLLTSCISVVYMLWLINQYWYIIIN